MTVAVGVLGLVFASNIAAMRLALSNLHSARCTTLAGQILQTEVEKLRMKDWATVAAYAAGPTSITLTEPFVSNELTAGDFTLSRRVENIGVELRKVTLSVTWRSLMGRSVSRSFITYYGKNGMGDYFYNNI